MIYLLFQSWNNTDSNHAGMKYMCRKLEELYPGRYKAIEVAREKSQSKSSFFLRGVNLLLRPINKRIMDKKLGDIAASLDLNDNDTVVLTEYMDKFVGHISIARAVKKRMPKVKVIGFSHLVPAKLNGQFDDEELHRWTGCVDGIVTLGHSLTDYYIQRGVPRHKIFTTFHYIDEYYLSQSINRESDFKVLVQGNQMRDMDTLGDVVRKNADIEFVVCQGVSDLRQQLDYPNVKLKGFLSEGDLRQLMAECPVSLNIMKDTIGSNVIVTSMGMGQAMVCSDVGSIRDYCNEAGCFFCKTPDDYTKAIADLRSDRARMEKMRSDNLGHARRFRIEKFEEELYAFVCRLGYN